ncbi:MAG: MFS transporter [Methanomicrobiales archaeon]|nr:MFS transporter [Methanomicrobiales archaeon]NYT20819.1 MFS transporter [Methanomicrobiales archaeon]
MRDRISLCLGVFSVMALSNAIVPILAGFGDSTISQGAIYAAYFFGAFLLVLPAGFLADRIGEIPLIRTGLVLTLVSGLLIMALPSTLLLILFRLMEGVGAGLFVPSALSVINARPDHEAGSGSFMAMLNIGLVAGLIGGGWLVEVSGMLMSGIMLFTLAAAVPALFSFFLRPGPARDLPPESASDTLHRLVRVTREYFWLWLSTVVILGTTGALTVLYPEFSDLPPGILGFTIAAMSLATAIAVVIVSRLHLPPIPAIRVAAVGMAVAVMLVFISPVSFIVVGAIAGVVMIAQLAFLATAEARQGVVMGLFNAASYGGMSLMPFLAGFIAEISSFFIAFLVVACSSVVVAATIGRCRCRIPGR